MVFECLRICRVELRFRHNGRWLGNGDIAGKAAFNWVASKAAVGVPWT